MKTPLLYGSLSALIGAIALFGLYFAGFHDSPEKLQTAQWVGGIVGLIASVTCMVLAIRERRADPSLNEPWTYGSAFLTAFLTGLVGVLLSTVLTYIYMAFVNPNFSEVIYQAQVAKMEAKGISAAQIEAGSSMMKRFMSPGVSAIMQMVMGLIFSTLIALVVAIFLRKRSVEYTSADATLPPVA